MLTVCSRTHPGSVRTINEDTVLWDPELGLLTVADGMGGHNAGEVASHLAVEAVRSFLKTSAETDDFTWPFGVDPTLSFAANRLMTALKIANRRVFRASEEDVNYNGMGTTVVAALAEGSHVSFTSVGDSRIYTLQGPELRQLTRDDSWVVMLQKESGLDASAFDKHPMRHVLTAVVGARPELDVKVEELALVDGQMIMFCSDGLHGALPDSVILSILESEPDLERAADKLVETAVKRDGSDNVTILLARYSQPPG
jgi:serine/threonine protein phosphatase PrpC